MKKDIKVCLVGSSGGHLTHLYMLKPLWEDKERFWVTFDKIDANSILKDEKVYHFYLDKINLVFLTLKLVDKRHHFFFL